MQKLTSNQENQSIDQRMHDQRVKRDTNCKPFQPKNVGVPKQYMSMRVTRLKKMYAS
jgi:hypothetical protein